MTRRLFLLRHGEAGAAATDFDRVLTERGCNTTSGIFERILSNDCQRAQLQNIKSIISSPYLRAQQTGVIAQGYLSSETGLETSQLLVPEANPVVLFDLLNQRQGDYLLVAHNPLLTTMLNCLLGHEPGREYMDTSSIAALELDLVAPGCGELLWHVYP